MDYCDIKDNLADVLDNHIGDAVPPCTGGDAFQSFVDPEVPLSLMRPKLPPCRIPEPALWAVFEALARAAHHMKCGSPRHTNASTPSPAHWTTVVHSDIKPANIFLSVASPDDPKWPGLPKFKVSRFFSLRTFSLTFRNNRHLTNPLCSAIQLGDFGLARRYRPNAHLQPGPHRGAGTHPFIAPVGSSLPATRDYKPPANTSATQEQFANPPPALHKPLLSSTNVYAVGLTLSHLLVCTPVRASDPIPPLLSLATVAFYSSRLLVLVRRCLHKLPEERIPVEELVDEIEKAVSGAQGRRALGMRPWLEEGFEGLRVVGDEAYDRRWKARM
nr:hypothetical protein CFP56_07869 [Quercus suber]